jgi:hypothetical protein
MEVHEKGYALTPNGARLLKGMLELELDPASVENSMQIISDWAESQGATLDELMVLYAMFLDPLMEKVQ